MPNKDNDQVAEEVEEEVIPGSTDQGPYTGGMEIPEEPYNPVAGRKPSEVATELAENQAGTRDDDDDDDRR